MKVRIPRDLNTVTRRDDQAATPAVESGLTAADTRAITIALHALYRTGAYPGVAFCLRRNGVLVFNRTMGHAEGNGPQDRPSTPKRLLTPQTPICLFSASKAVTAVLIHKLAEQGGIDLDQRVRHYVPEFAAAGKGDATISEVLAHRGGIATLKLPRADRNAGLIEDWDRVIRLICAAPPSSSQQIAYHAITGGFILGEILQRVTGQTIAVFLDKHFRQPMGFRYFQFGLDPADRALAAVNYEAGAPVRFPLTSVARRALLVPFGEVVRESNTARFMGAVIPAGNLYATADELGRFFQMLLDGGSANGQQLLRPETVARLVRPVGRLAIDRTLMIPMRYSEGLMLGTRPRGLYGPDASKAFGHLGFMNILGWADPSRNLSAALLTTGKAILGSHLIVLNRLLATINERCGRTAVPLHR